MTVIVDITIPAQAFELGEILTEYPAITIELERIVPLTEAIIPLFWISSGDAQAVETTLREHPQIEDVKILTDADDRQLFEVHWSPEINGVVQALIETNARVLEATGTAEEWEFRLRFQTREELSKFNQAVTDHGIPLTLRRMYNPTLPEDQSPLSTEQRDAILRAYQHGYFNVPRGITVADLAAIMDISDSALSQRLRRGLSTLVRETLVVDEDH